MVNLNRELGFVYYGLIVNHTSPSSVENIAVSGGYVYFKQIGTGSTFRERFIAAVSVFQL